MNLSGLTTLEAKVQTTQHAPWGTSTNIEKAFALIEEVIVRNSLSEKEVPDLIIFSDMQFDQAAGRDHLTQLQRIEKRFHDIGIKLSGKPYARPRIVFWNLRGDTYGFPATAAAPNVQMLSGFSPSLFQALVNGEAVAASVDRENPDDPMQAAVTPYDTMRGILDNARYDAVREVLSASTEGSLKRYHFERPVESEDSMDVVDDSPQQKRAKVQGGFGGGRGRGRGRGASCRGRGQAA